MNENEKDDSSPRSKKPYVKPAFLVIALRPDEAVLGACKTNGASRAGQSRALPEHRQQLQQPGVLRRGRGRRART